MAELKQDKFRRLHVALTEASEACLIALEMAEDCYKLFGNKSLMVQRLNHIHILLSDAHGIDLAAMRDKQSEACTAQELADWLGNDLPDYE